MTKVLVCLCVSLGLIFSVSGAMAGGGSVGGGGVSFKDKDMNRVLNIGGDGGGGKSIRNLGGTEGGNNVVSSNPIINLSMKEKIHSNSKI